MIGFSYIYIDMTSFATKNMTQNITNNILISNIFWGNNTSYDDVDDFQNENDCIILCSIFLSIFIIIICFYMRIFIKECRNTDQDAFYESLV